MCVTCVYVAVCIIIILLLLLLLLIRFRFLLLFVFLLSISLTSFFSSFFFVIQTSQSFCFIKNGYSFVFFSSPSPIINLILVNETLFHYIYFELIGMHPVWKVINFSKLSFCWWKSNSSNTINLHNWTSSSTLWLNGPVLAEFVNNLSEIKMVFVPFTRWDAKHWAGRTQPNAM